MSLRYDFDMFSITPKELQEKFRDDFAELGISQAVLSEQVALFRDPRVAQALQGADQNVKDFFFESGFGLNTYDSGAPEGFYPAYDEVARLRVIERLTQNMERFDLTNANLNGFSFEGFLTSLIEAKPWDEPSNGLTPAAKREQSAPFGPAGYVERLAQNGGDDVFGGTSDDTGRPVYTPPKKGLLSISPSLAVLAAAGVYILLMFGSELLGINGTQMVSSDQFNPGGMQTVDRDVE